MSVNDIYRWHQENPSAPPPELDEQGKMTRAYIERFDNIHCYYREYGGFSDNDAIIMALVYGGIPEFNAFSLFQINQEPDPDTDEYKKHIWAIVNIRLSIIADVIQVPKEMARTAIETANAHFTEMLKQDINHIKQDISIGGKKYWRQDRLYIPGLTNWVGQVYTGSSLLYDPPILEPISAAYRAVTGTNDQIRVGPKYAKMIADDENPFNPWKQRQLGVDHPQGASPRWFNQDGSNFVYPTEQEYQEAWTRHRQYIAEFALRCWQPMPENET